MILQDYLIPFKSLKEGMHEFDFQAEDLFFKQFEHPDIFGGSIKIHVNLNKKNTFLELDFYISGIIKIMCDRCLEIFDYPLDISEKLYVRFGEHFEEISDNVIVIPARKSSLDISQFIYEFSALSIPLKKEHPLDSEGNPTCDPEMISILKRHSRDKNEINPVWDNLKDILN